MSKATKHDGRRTPIQGGSRATGIEPVNKQESGPATPLGLAILAAVLDPAACRVGDCRDALFRAMALFEESAAICDAMAKKSPSEQIEMILGAKDEGCKGAGRLLDVLLRIGLNAPEPILTLSLLDDDNDTLRPYLEEHGNLEGKTGRKSWSSVRMVDTNLRLMIVDQANQHNQSNAARIQASELRDAAEARAKGCAVEDLRSRASRAYDYNEVWRDADADFDRFLTEHSIIKAGKVTGYAFPHGVADMLLKWKRNIRRRGGIKNVRPLTRDEVFGKASKKKIPKRAK